MNSLRMAVLFSGMMISLISLSTALADPPPGTPRVQLSDKHAATSLVKVGDELPDMELTDAKGAAAKLSELRGKKPAIVAFWKGTHHSRKEMMDDLSQFAKERGDKLLIATVQVGAAPAKPVAAAPAVQQLVDAKGTAYAAVAKGDAKMPRIFVVDAKGAIIWMDIEFAVDTRRQLVQVLNALLP